MIKRNRIVLLAVMLLWSAAAAAVVALILSRPPLIVRVAEAPLFVSSPTEVIALWALGATALLAAMLPAGWLRRSGWLLVGAALLVSIVWGADRLRSREPRAARTSQGQEEPSNGRTTLLVAVDGMSWTAMLPMLRRGELPNIARLTTSGSFGVLHSVRSYRKKVDRWGYWSPVVWTSMATGVRPPRHGITDFVSGGGYKPVTSWDRKAAAFWNLFSAFHKRIGVVGWWATWPAEEVSGYVVSSHVGLRGWRTGELHRPKLTYPEDLADQLGLRDDTPESIVDWANREIFPFERYPVLDDEGRKTIYGVLWQDRLYLKAARYLIEHREPLDLYAVYFEGIDALSHRFWKVFVDPDDADDITLPQGFREHAQIVPNYYRIIDSYLGELLEVLPKDVTVLVVSDHGFRLDPENRRGANHSPYGVLIARGKGIAQGRSIDLDPLGSLREALHGPMSALDILPTLLYLHGLPVAEDLDGKILGSLFVPRFLDSHAVARVRSYGDFSHDRGVHVVVDPGTSKEYEDRLRALGYIN